MHRSQLNDLIDQVAAVGLAGKSMQAKLASVVANNDLTPDHIRRIAEGANRKVGEAITKRAHATKQDPRVKFDLCDPEPLCSQARKTAEDSMTAAPTEYEILQHAIAENGGDPFAAPERKTASVLPDSLANQAVDMGYLHDQAELNSRDMEIRPEQAYDQLKLAETETVMRINQNVQDASDAYKAALSSAVEMVRSGITIPDIYMATYAAMGGNPGALGDTDQIVRLLLQDLKEKGVPNYRLGFRYPYDPDEVQAMSTDTLLALCRQACGVEQEGLPVPRPAVKLSEANLLPIPIDEVKVADRYMEKVVKLFPESKDQGMSNPDEANAWLVNRDSVRNPHIYMDQKYVDNLPNGQVRTVDADGEFIVHLNSIIGAKHRLVQLHGANEYLGLKMQELVNLVRGVKDEQAMVTRRYENAMQGNGTAKVAMIPAIAAGVGALARSVAPALATEAVSAGVKSMGSKPAEPAKEAEMTFADIAKLAGLMSALGTAGKTIAAADASSKVNLGAAALGLTGAVAQPVLSHVLPARSEDVTKRPKNMAAGAV